MHRLLITLLLSFPLICYAQIPKPKPNTYIDDYTSHLSADQLNDLNQQFRQLELTTGVQLAAILINDLPTDITLEDYSRDIGNTWKVGTAHNGLVYVAVLNTHKQRLEVAENLEGDIPDVTAFEIIESLKDNLRRQDYYGALSLLSIQVANHLGTQLIIPSNETANTHQQFQSTSAQLESDFDKAVSKNNFYANIGLIIIFLCAAGLCIWAYKYKKKYVAMYTVNGVYMGIGSSYYTGPGSDDSGDSGGGYGGFGGGGGGGFSGGGASGSW